MDMRRQVVTLPFTPDPLRKSLKLVTNAFGFEPARPLGPLAGMVGPILDQNYEPLTPQLGEYLDNHSRVALVAFEQNFSPTQDDVELIFTALVEIFENGAIDGFLWATVHLPRQTMPKSIILPSSGISYDMSYIVSGRNPHMLLVDWAPQQVVLENRSVSVFLTHNGVGSIQESLVNGVPLVVFPLAFDQPVMHAWSKKTG